MTNTSEVPRVFEPPEVTIATEVSDELMDAMAKLVPQLSSSKPPPTAKELQTIIDSDSTTLLIARTPQNIVGTLTLAIFRIPTGVRAWIEDVVVDKSARGKGIGRALNEAAIQHAKSAGAISVDLTSRPSRQEANRLYEQLGFKRRETHVFRFLPPESAGSRRKD